MQQRRARPLFDQFLFIGIPPSGTCDSKPEILAVFPPVELPDLSFQTLIDYSLPNGTKPLGKAIYENAISDMFTFSFNCHEVKFYGTTVHINPSKCVLPFYASDKTKNAIFALTIISRNTFIASHFTFLSFLALFSASKIVNPCISTMSPNDVSLKQMGTKMLPESYRNYQITNFVAHHPEIPLPIFFTDPIHTYLKHDVTQPLKLSQDFIIQPQPFAKPGESEEEISHQQLRALSYDTLFSLLSIEDIVTLFTGLITDRQIFIFGSLLQEVSMCIIALNELITKVHYTGSLIPVLPSKDQYIHILEAPTPFLIGAYGAEQLTTIEFDETAIFVNLDSRKIEVSVKLPTYPNQKKVIKKIKKLLTVTLYSKPDQYAFPSFFRSKLRQSVNFSTAAIEEVNKILANQLSSVLTEEIYGFFMTNLDSHEERTTEFNKDIFMTILPDDQKEFYTLLFESQTFTCYLQDLLLKYSREKGQRCVMPKKRKQCTRKSSRKISTGFLTLQPNSLQNLQPPIL